VVKFQNLKHLILKKNIYVAFLKIKNSSGEYMKLAINAGVIEKNNISGVGTFSINICKEICKLHSDTMVWATNHDFLNDININLIKSDNIFYRAFWDQFIFPKLIYGKADIVFFPVQEGILFPKIPQVIFLHDIVALRCPKYHPLLRVLSFKTRVRTALLNSSIILVPSMSVRNEAIDYYRINYLSDKIHIVPEGYNQSHFDVANVDLGFLSQYGLSHENYFLFVGRIIPTKNIHNIIKSFKIFQKMNNNKRVKLVLAGQLMNKKYYQQLLKLIGDKDQNSNIKFINYIPHSHLPTLYNGAISFLFPSYYEGFGLPILEAMACGCPVITSNIYSMPEVANDAGILIDPENIDEMAKHMYSLQTDSNLRAKYIELGYENIKKFSWKKSAELILDICKNLV